VRVKVRMMMMVMDSSRVSRVLWGPTANGCLAGPPATTTLRLRDATLGWFAAGAVGRAVGRTVGRPWGVGLG
jgi:hypothetical protein